MTDMNDTSTVTEAPPTSPEIVALSSARDAAARDCDAAKKALELAQREYRPVFLAALREYDEAAIPVAKTRMPFRMYLNDTEDDWQRFCQKREAARPPVDEAEKRLEEAERRRRQAQSELDEAVRLARQAAGTIIDAEAAKNSGAPKDPGDGATVH
jgi:hypothetical protein